MSEHPLHLPEYGDSGDLIGARRMRRAFRWGVTLLLFFTALLWVMEQFWRYSPADRMYRSALTLLPNQGRNLLRQAVKYDAQSASPSSKYFEALAEREEDDLVVSAYENASRIDPQNPDLAIKFGCQLFKLGLHVRAREQFRIAAESDAHNALAQYLEAAVLPALSAGPPDIDVAMSLVKQANGAGDAVAFPRPMWFPELPREGYWYAMLRRQMTQFCGAPIERFADYVLESSERALVAGRPSDSLPDLETLDAMGRRIAAGALGPSTAGQELAGGAPQLYLGLRAMSLAAEQRKRVSAAAGDALSEGLVALSTKLGPALRTIENFEKDRQTAIDAEHRKYGFPWVLIETALAALGVCFVAAYGLGKALGVQGASQSVPHSKAARAIWGVSFAAQLALLALVTALQRTSHGDLPGGGAIAGAWYTVAAVSLIAALLAPALQLPSPESVLQRLAPERRGEMPVVRRRYRMAYISLVKRHLGVQLGLTLGAMCVWVMAFRVFVATYPWMFPLLITGMEAEELALVRNILDSLG